MDPIGKIIERVVREKRIPIKEFAQMINTNRNNVYDIFRRDTIDTGLLQNIGAALGHDFFVYFNTSQPIHLSGMERQITALNKRITELEKELKQVQERLKDKEVIIKLLQKK